MPNAHGSNLNLPEILYFVRLGCDLIGRPFVNCNIPIMNSGHAVLRVSQVNGGLGARLGLGLGLG